MLAPSVLVAAILGLAGCGGDDKASDPPVPVSVELLPLQSITATVVETGAVPTQVLSGTATGDLAVLNGATIYVVIEDPDALVSTSSVLAYPDGRFALTLEGRALTAPGHRTGTLKVHASLAPGGRRPLRGSPLLVPYDVTVLDPFPIDPSSVRVEAPFGDPMPAATVTATLTSYITDWSASLSTTQGCSGAGQPLVPGPTQRVTCASDGTIAVRFPPGAPGTYPETLRVVAHLRYNGVGYTVTRRVALTRVVTANEAIDYVADPPELGIERTRGDSSFLAAPYELILNTGASAVFDGVEYLTSPAAAAGHPQAAAWWQALPSGTRTCDVSGASPECLPEGTYTARLHYRITRNGVPRDAYYPLTLEIRADLFPTQLGSYRDYQYAGNPATTMRDQVIASAGTSVTTRILDSRMPANSYLSDFHPNAGGWYMANQRSCRLDGTGCTTTTFTPGTVYLPAGLEPGYVETTVSTVVGAPYQTQTRVATVNGLESVTVPAGTFSALKITLRTTTGSTVYDWVTWWVPGIGHVKTSSGSQTWLLTGFGVAPVP